MLDLVMRDFVKPWHRLLLDNDQRSLQEIRGILDRAVRWKYFNARSSWTQVLALQRRMHSIHQYSLVADLIIVAHKHVRAYLDAIQYLRLRVHLTALHHTRRHGATSGPLRSHAAARRVPRAWRGVPCRPCLARAGGRVPAQGSVPHGDGRHIRCRLRSC